MLNMHVTHLACRDGSIPCRSAPVSRSVCLSVVCFLFVCLPLAPPPEIFSLQSLERDLTESGERELAALEKEIADKVHKEVEALHDKLLWDKDKTTTMKRIEQVCLKH